MSKPRLYAIAAVLITVAILYFGWSRYYEFLNQGRRPPESTRLLNQIEKEGFPAFEFEDLAGKKYALPDFKNKVVILNFWASWCEPCVVEFPSLQNLIAHFKGEVILIAVSGDYEKQDVYNFLKAFKVDDKNILTTWDKDQELAKKVGTFKLPESYILGKNNRFIRKITGIDKWDTPEAFLYFQDLVDEKY